MGRETHVPPLRWALPLAQLVACAVTLWPLRSMLAHEIQNSMRAYGIISSSPRTDVAERQRSIPFELSDPDLKAKVNEMELREWIVTTLNMPGSLPDMVYGIASPAHQEWTPRGMFFWTWRDLSWPIIGLLFWWIAGRSLEALLVARNRIVRPKIGWWEVLLSLPVLAYGGVMAVMMSLDPSAREELPWVLFFVFGTMWFLLGASNVVAFAAQWRLRRRISDRGEE